MAPSKEAMEAAANAMPCLCEWPMEGQHTTPCPKVYAPEIAAMLDAYAAERIGEMSAMLMQRGDRAITERDAAIAKLEAAEAAVMDVQRQAAVQVVSYVESRDAALARAQSAEDALEASQAQVARLRAQIAYLNDAWTAGWDEVTEAFAQVARDEFPADLLEAVRHMDDAPGAGRDKAYATLVRYGLMPAAGG